MTLGHVLSASPFLRNLLLCFALRSLTEPRRGHLSSMMLCTSHFHEGLVFEASNCYLCCFNYRARRGLRQAAAGRGPRRPAAAYRGPRTRGPRRSAAGRRGLSLRPAAWRRWAPAAPPRRAAALAAARSGPRGPSASARRGPAGRAQGPHRPPREAHGKPRKNTVHIFSPPQKLMCSGFSYSFLKTAFPKL